MAGDKNLRWADVIEDLTKKGIRVVNLGFVINGIEIFLPGKDEPAFREFALQDRPSEYRFFRKIALEQGKQEEYLVIEADYGNKRLQIWANEDSRKFYFVVQ